MNTKLLSSFLLALTLSGAAQAQDVSYPPAGATVGAVYDERAPSGHRIRSVTATMATWVVGLELGYMRRNGNNHGTSAQIGGTNGTASTFPIAIDDYIDRIDVWAIPVSYTLIGLQVHTMRGTNRLFGTMTGIMTTFQAPAGTEIVGVLGNASTVVSSLGVTTRPVLASYETFGTPCDSSLGTMRIGYVFSNLPLSLGQTTRIEFTHANSPATMMAIGFSAIPSGIPLDTYGMTGCSLYVSPDIMQTATITSFSTGMITIVVPNNTSLLGAKLSFQGATVGAPNAANFALSDALTSMIGLI